MPLLTLFPSLIALCVAALVMVGSESVAEYLPPTCWEDEVILYDGSCFPMDDSTYTDGYWYPLFNSGRV